MAKSTPRRKLPKIRFACFCENAIEGVDHVWSLIRVLDKITIAIQLPETVTPEIEEALAGPFPIQPNFFATISEFDSTEMVKLEIGLREPGKRRASIGEVEFAPSGPHRSANVRANLRLGVRKPGTYWFDLQMDGRNLVRLPLDVEIDIPVKTGQ
jgi:hypothetical protein